MSKYLAIKNNDIDNGDGLRVSVWFSGCPHKCRDCHNSESWNENTGKDFTDETIDYIIELLNTGLSQDLSILGGEPLAPYNRQATIRLVNEVRKVIPGINIWLWTGYELEELGKESHNGNNLLDELDVDVIIDGRYSKTLHVDDKYRGSSNQRIIDHKKSRNMGSLVFL